MAFPLRFGLNISDLFWLLIIGAAFTGLVYLIQTIVSETREISLRETSFTPWSAPQFYLFLGATIMAGAGVLLDNGPFDLQVLELYFATNLRTILLALALCLFLSGMIYFLARRLALVRWLTVLHLVLSLGCCLYITNNLPYPPDVVFSTHHYALQPHIIVFTLVLLFFATGQLLLILNLGVGLLRKWQR